MRLPENLRDQLKTPLGILIPNSDVNKENILKHISDSPLIITVGDKTTENMLNLGIIPSLQIIDGQEKRKKRELLTEEKISTVLTCKNPQSEITDQSICEIKKALTSKHPVRLIVDGEEDLLVIPVCIHAPLNSIVLYGQPNEGLVVVSVSTEIKNKAQSILDSMI